MALKTINKTSMKKMLEKNLVSKLVFFVIILAVAFFSYSSFEPADPLHMQIKQTFSEKYDVATSKVKIEIGYHEENYYQGDVQVDGEGAIFFAVVENDEVSWLWDGNGEVPCSRMVERGFPDTVIGEWCS